MSYMLQLELGFGVLRLDLLKEQIRQVKVIALQGSFGRATEHNLYFCTFKSKSIALKQIITW